MGMLIGVVTMAVAGDQIREQQGKDGKGQGEAVADKDATQVIGECVLAIRTVASFNAEHHFVANYNKKLDKNGSMETKDGAKSAIGLALGMCCMMFVMAMNYYGGYLVRAAITFQEMMTPMFMMMVSKAQPKAKHSQATSH